MNIDELTTGELKQLRALLKQQPVEKPSNNGELRIVVLDRGWVVIGLLYRNGDECRLERAKIIRRWGTTRGLGQLATGGPTRETVLDDAGTIRFTNPVGLPQLDVDASKWAEHYGD